MTPKDRKPFAQLLTDCLAFYRQDVSEFTLSVWWSACEDFDLEQVRKALTAHAMDAERGKWQPMPSDIVRVLRGTVTDRSLIAWGKLLEAMQRIGAYQSVVFDDPAIHAAVEDLGGWTKVCRSTMDELPHVQRRFTELHRVYAVRPGLAYPPKLIGEHESANALAGRAVAPPMLIGDPSKAVLVLQTGAAGPRVSMTPLTHEAVKQLERRPA